MTTRAAAPIILLLLAVACSGGDPGGAASAPATGEAVAGDDSLAPGFELPSLGGDAIALADSAGTVRLIDFWATWCAPCREEIPMLNELHTKYGGKGLTIIGISDEDPELVREFVERHEVQFTNLIDPGGTVTGEYVVPGLPTAFLVDGEGRVVDRFFGPKPGAILEKKIVEMLGEPAA